MKSETHLSPREKFIAREIVWADRKINVWAIFEFFFRLAAALAFIVLAIIALGVIHG